MCVFTNLNIVIKPKKFSRSPLLPFFAEILLLNASPTNDWREPWRRGEMEVRFVNGTKYSEKGVRIWVIGERVEWRNVMGVRNSIPSIHTTSICILGEREV